MSWRYAALVGLLGASLSTAIGCKDRACIELADVPEVCPSRTEAFELLQDDCGSSPVLSVDSAGELEDGACCYDVTSWDDESLTPFCATTSVGVGAGGSGGQGGTGAIGGGGAGGAVGDWSCVGFVPPPTPIGDEVIGEIGVLEAYTAAAFPNAPLRVCPHGDAGCQSPFVETQTNGFGFVTVAVPRSELLAYEVSPATGAERTIHYEHRIPADDPFGVLVEPVEDGRLSGWRGAVGASSGPGFGDVMVREIYDCSGFPATDVVLSLEPLGLGFFYLLGGEVDTSLFQATGNQAVALGVPTGSFEVWAFVASSGTPLGVFPIHVESEALTTLRVEPTALP